MLIKVRLLVFFGLILIGGKSICQDSAQGIDTSIIDSIISVVGDSSKYCGVYFSHSQDDYQEKQFVTSLMKRLDYQCSMQVDFWDIYQFYYDSISDNHGFEVYIDFRSSEITLNCSRYRINFDSF